MIFHETFDRAVGGSLIAVILVLLVGFSTCINLLIQKDCSTRVRAVKDTEKDIFDDSKMHVSEIDSSLQKGAGDASMGTLASVGGINASFASIQSAPVNLAALKKKKEQERKNQSMIGPRLTSSPKPKSKLAMSPEPSERCPSPSAR